MANSGKVISTTVKLDGVEAVKKSLEALGKAGAEAFKSIRDAADKISPGLGGKLDGALAKVQKGLKALQDNARNVGNQFGKLRVATTRLGGEFLGVAKRIGLLGGAILGAGGAFLLLTKRAADNADAVAKNAEALGLSVKSFQSLEFAANQSNISSEEFGKGFAKLSKLIGDGLQGDKAAVKKLRDLGIAYKDASGKLVVPKTNQEAFLRFADTIGRIQDPAKRAAVAGELLGKSYAKWIPLLSQGRNGLKGLQDQFNQSGLGFTEDEARKADAFGDALDFLGRVIGQLRDKILLKFVGPLTTAFERLTDYIVANSATILDRAGQIANRVAPIFLDIINAIFGNKADIKTAWIIQLQESITGFATAAYDAVFNIVIPAFDKLREAADLVAGAFNSLFGTEITGQSLLIAIAVGQLVGVFGLLASAIGVVSAAFGVLSAIIGPVLVGIGAALGLSAGAVAAIVAAVATAAVLIYAYWDEIVAYASQAWELIAAGASLLWQGIVAAFQAGIDGIVGVWRGVTEAITALWRSVVDYITSTLNSIKAGIVSLVNSISSAISRLKSLASSAAKAAAEGGGAKRGYASGGYIRGPGTGTSDSIPAYLSNGEFVIRAAAVRKYGAQLFAALNGMRLSPNTLGRYALGGLVGFPSAPMTALPAAASGPTSTLNLVLDGQTYGGLTGPAETIKSLERAIKARRIRATGRPSPYER